MSHVYEGTVSGLKSSRAAVLYLCFLLSGVAGLIYEILWAKYMALFVGSTGLAQLIVLATFMGGLALGSHVLGRLSDRVKNPLSFYAVLEVGIGLYAILFSRIFELSRWIFIVLVKSLGLSEWALVLAKILACVLCMIIPTFLMGGTLPALSRYVIRRVSGVGPQIARLYFLNSLGAVVGCLLAGFYLIRFCGLEFSMIIGGFLNIIVGIASYIVMSGDKSGYVAPVENQQVDNKQSGTSVKVAVVLVCVSFSGAVSMMYEVSWVRLLSLALGSSTYSFSIMLATFILGLTIGGFLLSLRKRTDGYGLIFGISEVCVGLTVLISLPFYVRLPFCFNQVASCLSREPHAFGLYQFAKFLLCAAVMIIPTVFQGITLPAAVKVLTSEMGGFGRRVGYIFAVNTLGTLAGIVFAGCIGLPMLSIKGTLELAIVVNGILGIAVLLVSTAGRVRLMSVVISVVVSLSVWGWYAARLDGWNREVLQSGVYRTRSRISSYADLEKRVRNRKTLYYKDGIDSTVAVQDIFMPEQRRILIVNGKVDASTGKDMATQKMLAHLPLLIADRMDRVLVVGVGSGATIGSVLTHDVRAVDVVELSGDIIEASRYFADINGSYWADSRTSVYREDAKTFLQVTAHKYEVIISEPTNPWIAGIAGVFSREYFEDCRARLEPGGLFVQWMPAYELEDSTFFMMLETFSRVFPYYTIWNSTRSDAILVGSTEPYHPDFNRMAARIKVDSVARDLETLEISSLLPLLWMQMSDRASALAGHHWAGLQHSDMFPVLEYVAPRGFFVGASAGGLKWIDERAWAPCNSRLWIMNYLATVRPSVDQLNECFNFNSRYDGLFDLSQVSWGQKWTELYGKKSIPELVKAELINAGISPVERLRKSTGCLTNETLLKSACASAFDEYLEGRSCLVDGRAGPLLAEFRRLTADGLVRNDADMLSRQGRLEYDLGLFDDAACHLEQALILNKQQGQSLDVSDTALALCRTLLAAEQVDRAMNVHELYLSEFKSDLRSAIMLEIIRAAQDKR